MAFSQNIRKRLEDEFRNNARKAGVEGDYFRSRQEKNVDTAKQFVSTPKTVNRSPARRRTNPNGIKQGNDDSVRVISRASLQNRQATLKQRDTIRDREQNRAMNQTAAEQSRTASAAKESADKKAAAMRAGQIAHERGVNRTNRVLQQRQYDEIAAKKTAKAAGDLANERGRALTKKVKTQQEADARAKQEAHDRAVGNVQREHDKGKRRTAAINESRARRIAEGLKADTAQEEVRGIRQSGAKSRTKDRIANELSADTARNEGRDLARRNANAKAKAGVAKDLSADTARRDNRDIAQRNVNVKADTGTPDKTQEAPKQTNPTKDKNASNKGTKKGTKKPKTTKKGNAKQEIKKAFDAARVMKERREKAMAGRKAWNAADAMAERRAKATANRDKSKNPNNINLRGIVRTKKKGKR